MKKERLLVFFILGLLLTTTIVGLVGAQGSPILNPIKDLFTFGSENAVSQNIAKYLFFALVSLLVWSALDASGFVQQSLVRWGISLIVGFLAVAYLAPEAVWATLISYTAFGITMLFFFPFLILLIFTFRIVRAGKSTGVVFQSLMWIVYLLLLILLFAMGIYNKQLPVRSVQTWIFLGVIAITAIFVIFNRGIVKLLGKSYVRSQIEEAENTEALAAAVTGARAETARGTRRR